MATARRGGALTGETVRVVLADDHPIIRDGLTALLQAVDGIEVIGTAADGREAVRAAVTLTPDVLVIALGPRPRPRPRPRRRSGAADN